ncbi:MAG: YncE family protein, partial [Acidimicrobiales bacterium]
MPHPAPNGPCRLAAIPRRPGPGRLLAAALAVGCAVATAACAPPPLPGATQGAVAYVATLAGQADPGDAVAVVDTSTSKTLTPIATGTLPSAMAATPDGKDLLVTDKGIDQLTEVATATGRVVRRVTVGLE